MQDLTVFINQYWLAVQSGQWLHGYLWIYLVLVIMVMLEGPVSILLAAGAASAGFLQPLPVFAAATLGNLIADMLWYTLGYHGRIDWFLRRRGRFGVDPQKLERIKRIINRHVVKLLFFAKATDVIIVPVLIATGAARVGWRRCLPVIFATNLLTNLVMVVLGYFLASNLLKVQEGIRYAGFAVFFAFLLAASIYLRRLLGREDILAKLEADSL